MSGSERFIDDQRAGEPLLESEVHYQAMAEAATDAIITINSESTILLVNPAAEKIFGYSIEEMLGQPLTMLMPEYLRHLHQAGITRYVRTGQKHIDWAGVRLSGLHKSGREIPLEISFGVFMKEGERFFTGIVRDVTERKREEEQLREQAALLDHAQDAIIVRDLEDRVLYWNKSAERIYGWRASEAIGKDIRDLLYTQDPQQFEAATRSLVESGEWVGELSHRTKEGKEIIAQSRWTLVPDDAGKPKSVFAIHTDIT